MRTRVIDLVGSVVVAALLAGGGWLAFVGGDETSAKVNELSEQIGATTHDIATLRAVQGRQEVLLAVSRRELAERGQLPVRAPIEEYFRTLSRLAADCGLEVKSQSPLPSRQYSGLLEQRFSYEVTGSTDGIMRFLAAIERTDYWADVSHLSVQRGTEAVAERAASLTLSLFSALPTDVSERQGEGT